MRLPNKIVVDTNIIFSCLLNSNSTIGDLIFNSTGVFEFYSASYMNTEIRKHWKKLKAISKLTDAALETAIFRIHKQIKFVDESLIPPSIWIKAEKLVSNIDEDDVDFVALNDFVKGHLWTGDKVLHGGLKLANYKRVLTTTELQMIRAQKREKKG